MSARKTRSSAEAEEPEPWEEKERAQLARTWREQEGFFGRIVSVGSSAVREPIPGLMLSNAHRSGLLAALKTIATDVAADGVTQADVSGFL